MAAIVVAAISPVKKEPSCEHHQPVLEVIILALDKRFRGFALIDRFI